MVDRFTQILVTVIAADLMALIVRQAVPPATAQHGDGCGTVGAIP